MGRMCYGQVQCGSNSFTYDAVFGGSGLPHGQLYEDCVLPLVQGLFKGYNATVFAYGQTGSGKTYTMGSAFTAGQEAHGVIPNVMESIFSRIAATKDAEFTVRVGFVEIHKVQSITFRTFVQIFVNHARPRESASQRALL
jgi:hypothetical protein